MPTIYSRYGFVLGALCYSLSTAFPVQANPYGVYEPGIVAVQHGQRMTTLRGSALLYYVYRRYGASYNFSDSAVYREDKGPNAGAIYYRENNSVHTVVWLTTSSKDIEVPQILVHQYLPDYEGKDNAYTSRMNTRPKQLYGGLIETAYSYAIARGLSAQTVSHVGPLRPAKQALPALTVKQIIQRVLPSIVRITVLNKAGIPAVQGSGIVVGDDLIATNLHVVRGGHAVTANFMNGRSEEVFGVVGADNEHDLVLLRGFTHGVQPLPLDDETTAQVGDPVLAVGSPEGLGGSVSTGIVSGFRLYNGSKVIQTTAPISHGSSGGGLVDMQGRVIGITSFFNSEGQNLNFAYPAYFLSQLILHQSKQLVTWKDIENYASASTNVAPLSPALRDHTSPAADTAIYTTKTLAGVKEVKVDVSDIDTNAQQDGLATYTIKTATELRLRQAGIPIVDSLTGATQKPGVILDVEISTLNLTSEGRYVYTLNLETFETTTLSRDVPVRSLTTTWNTGTFGIIGKEKLKNIRDTINDLVDKFANDYLAQNPASK